MHFVQLFCLTAIALLVSNCHCEGTSDDATNTTTTTGGGTNATEEHPQSLLDMLPPEKATELKATLANETEDSVAGREKVVQAWIEKQADELKAKLVPFENAEKANEELTKDELATIISQRKLSPEAADVEQKIASIELNKSLKPDEKEQQLDSVVDSIPESAKKELGIENKTKEELHGLIHDVVKQEKEQAF